MAEDEYVAPRRRQHDLIIDLLTDRIDAVARMATASNADTMTRLDAHIAECAGNQRWILRGLVGLCAWVVLHSPEVMGLGAKILSGVGR